MVSKSVVVCLASIFVMNSTVAFAQQSETPTEKTSPNSSLDELGELVAKLDQNYKLQVQGELLAIDILIRSIETVKAAHEKLGLSSYGQKIAIPLTFLGAGLVGAHIQVGSQLSKRVGSKSPWWKEYRQLLKAERDAQFAADALKSADSKAELVAAKAKVLDKLRIKPGAFYNAARVLRAGGYFVTYVGGLALTAVIVGESMMIVLGTDELDKTIVELRERATVLEAQI